MYTSVIEPVFAIVSCVNVKEIDKHFHIVRLFQSLKCSFLINMLTIIQNVERNMSLNQQKRINTEYVKSSPKTPLKKNKISKLNDLINKFTCLHLLSFSDVTDLNLLYLTAMKKV